MIELSNENGGIFMESLIIKTKKETKILKQTSFKAEEEFENLVFKTPELLEDIFLIKRQVRGGNKPGIPDIIGVDEDGNICIIEMKNVTVDSDVIPQVLSYAIWAEKNPDSIKSLWLECEDKPEDLEIDWDEAEIRIIIIAPKILNSTLEYVSKIDYTVDLFEVRQYLDNDNQFYVLSKLEAENSKKVKPVRGRQEYDEEEYKKLYNHNSVNDFLRYIKEIENIIKNNNWQLETNYKKKYCSFKYGLTNIFGIHWVGSKTFSFRFKIAKDDAEKFGVKMTKYSKTKPVAFYYIEPGKTKTEDFTEIIKFVYNKILG